MASLRTAHGLPPTPSDGLRLRRTDEAGSRSGARRPVNNNMALRETDTPGTASPGTSPLLRASNRIARPSPTWRTGLPQPSPLSPPAPSPKTFGSASATSGSSVSHARNASCSSSTGQVCDGGRKAAPSLPRVSRTYRPRDPAGRRKDSGGTISSSPGFEPHGQADPNPSSSQAHTEPHAAHVARTLEPLETTAQTPFIYPELDRYRDLRDADRLADRQIIDEPHRQTTHDLPPHTPASALFSGSSSQISAVSGSPSTRLSESPGPGPYSRDTTPTSTCSQSPILFAPGRLMAATMVQPKSPASVRPPISSRRTGSIQNATVATSADPHGLASVRESMASSSSNSTVRDGDKNTRQRKSSDGRSSPLTSGLSLPKGPYKTLQVKGKAASAPGLSREARETGPIVRPAPRLVTAQPMKSLSSPGLGPPRRPSRDGTQDMPSPLFDPAPVIQSNLSSLPRPFERRVSEPANSKALSGSTSLPSHSKKSASTPHTSVARGKQPRSENSRDPAEPKKVQSLEPLRSNQTSSAKTGSSFSARFPFFGRRKTAPDGIKPEKAEEARLKKPGRKGPVAGTGHEGYGRVGAIRRRSSGASNATGGAVDSPSTQPSLGNKDSFLADRVHPVVIAGGEVVENQNAGAADLGTSEGEKAVLGGGRPGTHSKTPSGHALPSDKASRLTVWPPIALHGPHGGASTLPNPHAGGAAGVSVPKPPSLALRRSVQRLRSSPDNPIRLPQPIIVDAPVSASPPTTSIDASSTSGDSHLQLQKETSHASNDSYPAATKPKKRGRLPRKWNLFGRSQSRQATRENGEEVQATVIAVDKKRVAFYAMMDSSESQESKPLSSREELRMSDVSIPSPSLLFNVPEHRPGNASSPLELQHIATTTPRSLSSVVRDDHGQVNTPSGQFHADPVPDPSSHPGKASRLPQVGRIPQVGQNRAENASAQTFSRPFRTSLQAAPRVTLSVYDPESIATGPTPPRPSTPVPDSTVERAPTDSEAEDCCNSDSLSKLSSETGCAAEEFLAFYLRKHSVGTTDTSSCCSTSVCVGADSTAVVPEPDDPLDEDEIWDEYNDLLDEGAVRTFSAAMAPSHPLPALPSSAHDGTTGRQSVWMVPESHKTGTHSRALSQSTSGSADMAQRIGRAFQPHPVHSAAPLAAPDPTPRSSPGRRKSQAPAEDGPRAGADRHSVASTLTVFTDCSAATSSDEESPLAQVNLRVGSMSVSKWLTFGHVLFSDVRHELDLVDGPAKRLSILVIDGLGNDDWSFYAAETYPAASFYNLSPRAAAPADAQKAPSRFPLSPPNHHQVQYRCHLDKFPFAPQSFDCVVYRFPVAAPESCYRNIIHESRRVLRTGGHIELSVLDADLNSMGNQARRTVRWLKERIHGEAAGVNLASTADVMLRLLGQAGFSSVKAARVGVPVASSITRPEAQRRSDSKGTGQREAASLAEMMRDKSPMADESINKLVTRVGRWWYTRCYENAAGSSAEKSIWCNKALLSECEELGTSLKLMVCCARAPNRIPSL